LQVRPERRETVNQGIQGLGDGLTLHRYFTLTSGVASQRARYPQGWHALNLIGLSTKCNHLVGERPGRQAWFILGATEDVMNVSEAIRNKRAVRKFQDRPLPAEVVAAILNAGRRAQSSKNTQPWQFVAIQDRARLVGLSECGTYADHLATAALGVAILTPDPAANFSLMFDAGQAAAYMQLAAWELGVGSCLVTFHQAEKAREVLGAPVEWYARMGMSFGYPADEEKLSAPPKKGGRKPLEEFVHWDRW
jgi:nitroreductase